jgi:2,5-diketo-D-gluconate reductase A
MVTLEQATLRHGSRMPRIGLGTAQLTGTEVEIAVAQGIDAGHRLIDTAASYGNETGVGRGIRVSGLPRDEVFVTTKFNAEAHSARGAQEACLRSLDALGFEYVDLLLAHWPNPWLDGYVDAWRGMLELREQGVIRAAGVSNFKPAHLDRLVDETGVAPEVNQIELNPRVQRLAERAAHDRLGIVTQAYSPLGGPGAPLLAESSVVRIATVRGTWPAEVLVRWHLDLGLNPVIKSSTLSHVREVLEVGEVSLTDSQIAQLNELDGGPSAGIDSDVFGH